MSDAEAVLEANAAFYRAMLTGDFAAMLGIWAEDDTISCIHPGWPAIVGRDAVLGSWSDIFQGQRSIPVVCHEPHIIQTGDEARVLCIEVVQGVALAATNYFRRANGAWRLIHHQSSQIVATHEPGASDQTSSSGSIH